MVTHYFSVHAHFYQPPREDPLTGKIPREVGASPFQNWNEKIHAECYRPNAELRNFEQISFNLGPTLGAWMESHDPTTCRRIVEQDLINYRRYGVGNAMGQAYNHTILPLANYSDKVTQVRWGIADFEYRFGRKPLGMWLPETAADTETLDVLAQNGIQYTILAPWQADQTDLDVTEPYSVFLLDQRQITVFFYQSELSSRVSFDAGATMNADTFAQQFLLSQFKYVKTRRGEPQIVLMASDGELYGHHQFLRDRFLARLVDGATSQLGVRPTYPGLWLKDHPPRQSITIREKTSWSCHHGVVRWMGKCDCVSGNSDWKTLMRTAFDQLADELDGLYLDVVSPFIANPWELRNRYIHVLLGQMTTEDLVGEMAGKALTSQQIHRVHLMLEAQRERQRMYTSCGWFFEDFDRIEPGNNVAYAAQATLLARQATGVDLEALLLPDLVQVKSERSNLSADRVFQRHLQKAETMKSERIGFAD
jgi:hypothetical protein